MESKIISRVIIWTFVVVGMLIALYAVDQKREKEPDPVVPTMADEVPFYPCDGQKCP